MIGHGVFPDELQLCQLQQLVRVRNAVKHAAQILQRFIMADRHERSKCVALAGMVILLRQEVLDELRSIRNELLEMLVYRCDGEDGILSNVGMAVLETLACRL